MKTPGSFYVAALVGLATVYGQTMNDPVLQNPVRASTRLQLVASLEQTSVKIGDPIKLHFRLKNVSQATLPLAFNGFNTDNWLMVTDASGREPPLTKGGDRMRQIPRGGSSVSYSLEPGEDDGDHFIDVAELYQLDRPGNYFLRIARRISLPSDPRLPSSDPKVLARIPFEEAVSDSIPFTITP